MVLDPERAREAWEVAQDLAELNGKHFEQGEAPPARSGAWLFANDEGNE
jgi:hypothetical protein